MKTSLIYCNSHYEWTETTSNLKHRCVGGTWPNRVSDQSLPKISFKIILSFFFISTINYPFSTSSLHWPLLIVHGILFYIKSLQEKTVYPTVSPPWNQNLSYKLFWSSSYYLPAAIIAEPWNQYWFYFGF